MRLAQLVGELFAVGDIERDADHADNFAIRAAQRAHMGFENAFLPVQFVGERFAGQGAPVRVEGRVLSIVGLKIFGESLAGEASGFHAEGIQAGAHAGGVAQFFVGGPQDGRHALDHHGQARAPLVAFNLGFLEVFEHAVDGNAQECQFVLPRHIHARGQIAARADLGDVLGEIGDARDDETFEQVERSRAENESRGDEQQQKLHQAGVALLVDRSGQQDADEQGWPAVDIVLHLIGRQGLAVQRTDEIRCALGDGCGSRSEIGPKGGGRKRLCRDGHQREVAQVLNFSGIEEVAHDHGSGDGASGIACENGARVHQRGPAGKIENSCHLAAGIFQVEEQRAGLQVIIQARGNGHFAAVRQVEAPGEEFAAVGIENDHEADFQLLKRWGGEFGLDITRPLAAGEFVGQIPGGVFTGGLVEGIQLVR